MSNRHVKSSKDINVSSGSQGRQVTAGNGPSVNEGTSMTLSERFSLIHKKQQEQKKAKKGVAASSVKSSNGKPSVTAKRPEDGGIRKRGAKGGDKRKTGKLSSDKSARKDSNIKKKGDKKPAKKEKKEKKVRSEDDLNKDLDTYFESSSAKTSESK